jgi:hypothetical protein
MLFTSEENMLIWLSTRAIAFYTRSSPLTLDTWSHSPLIEQKNQDTGYINRFSKNNFIVNGFTWDSLLLEQ